MEIQYVIGDATTPPRDRPGMIVHVCNDVGAWGKGFVMALSKRWPEPQREARAWFEGQRTTPPHELGEVQFVLVEDGLWVANLIGQRGLRRTKGVPPIRYDAVQRGMRRVAEEARRLGATVHMPRIGCGLAGGTWDKIEPILEAELIAHGVPVAVYDLPSRRAAPRPGAE